MKFCEGQLMPHQHTEDVEHCQITFEDSDTIRAYLCRACIAFDKKNGYFWKYTPDPKLEKLSDTE